MSHANISVFVPHLGCPNLCSFCNQHSISGSVKQPNHDDIDNAVSLAMSSDNYNAENTELAFFGGSFTAVDREYMMMLLKTAYRHVVNKNVKGIRISTRPDCINEEILDVLKKHGVTAIELGAQSMSDDVLKSNNRGHTAADVKYASNAIKKNGFELGLQMMTGLYKSSDELDIFTAEEIIKLKPDTVRIYPTITLKNTKLEALFLNGEYTPPCLEQTVTLCARLVKMFNDNNIKVIRLGLHTINADSYVAGPWHAAFGELCESKAFFDKVLINLKEKGEYVLRVSPKNVSKLVGNKKKNINLFMQMGYKCTVVADEGVNISDVTVERMGNSCT